MWSNKKDYSYYVRPPRGYQSAIFEGEGVLAYFVIMGLMGVLFDKKISC